MSELLPGNVLGTYALEGRLLAPGDRIELDIGGAWLPGFYLPPASHETWPRFDTIIGPESSLNVKGPTRLLLSPAVNLRWPEATPPVASPVAPREPLPLIPCAPGELIAFFTAPSEFSSEALGAFLNLAIERDSSIGLRLTRTVRLFR